MIDYPRKLSAPGKRPRFNLTTRQTKLAAYLPEIEVALAVAGQTTAWLRRPIRSAPFDGRMAEQPGEGAAAVLQFLNRAAPRKSLARRKLTDRPSTFADSRPAMGQRPPLSDMPADQLERQARRYRRMADQAHSKPVQNAYLRLAKRYERLAEERKARDEK